MIVLDILWNHLRMKSQSWSFRERGIPLWHRDTSLGQMNYLIILSSSSYHAISTDILEVVLGSTSLMSWSLLLQHYPACLVRLTWIDFVMGGKWLYSCCSVGCCLQDLFNIAHSILVAFKSYKGWYAIKPSGFFHTFNHLQYLKPFKCVQINN